jgi:hypothetical protein
MEILVSTLAVIVAASCLVAFVRSDLKEESREAKVQRDQKD